MLVHLHIMTSLVAKGGEFGVWKKRGGGSSIA